MTKGKGIEQVAKFTFTDGQGNTLTIRKVEHKRKAKWDRSVGSVLLVHLNGLRRGGNRTKVLALLDDLEGYLQEHAIPLDADDKKANPEAKDWPGVIVDWDDIENWGEVINLTVAILRAEGILPDVDDDEFTEVTDDEAGQRSLPAPEAVDRISDEAVIDAGEASAAKSQDSNTSLSE